MKTQPNPIFQRKETVSALAILAFQQLPDIARSMSTYCGLLTCAAIATLRVFSVGVSRGILTFFLALALKILVVPLAQARVYLFAVSSAICFLFRPDFVTACRIVLCAALGYCFGVRGVIFSLSGLFPFWVSGAPFTFVFTLALAILLVQFAFSSIYFSAVFGQLPSPFGDTLETYKGPKASGKCLHRKVANLAPRPLLIVS